MTQDLKGKEREIGRETKMPPARPSRVARLTDIIGRLCMQYETSSILAAIADYHSSRAASAKEHNHLLTAQAEFHVANAIHQFAAALYGKETPWI
jgi:hypothetical protein